MIQTVNDLDKQWAEAKVKWACFALFLTACFAVTLLVVKSEEDRLAFKAWWISLPSYQRSMQYKESADSYSTYCAFFRMIMTATLAAFFGAVLGTLRHPGSILTLRHNHQYLEPVASLLTGYVKKRDDIVKKANTVGLR